MDLADHGGGGGCINPDCVLSNTGLDGENGDDWWDVEPVDPDVIFDDMADESDIAFNYPIDGCFARAYLMQMRILQRYGILPWKVWAFDDLKVTTTGSFGDVTWGYHVAPIIPVTQPDGTLKWFVIDPSIADGPVTTDEWLTLMNTTSDDSDMTTTPFWVSPVADGAGHGYFPNGLDPFVVDEYSNTLMELYQQCGEAGDANCPFIEPSNYPYEYQYP